MPTYGSAVTPGRLLSLSDTICSGSLHDGWVQLSGDSLTDVVCSWSDNEWEDDYYHHAVAYQVSSTWGNSG